MGFVDNDETEVRERSEESGAGTDDDFRGSREKEGFPEEMAFGFGLFRVEEDGCTGEGFLEDFDELRG